MSTSTSEKVPRLTVQNQLTVDQKMELLERVATFHDLGDEAREILRIRYTIPALKISIPSGTATTFGEWDVHEILGALSELCGKCLIEVTATIDVRLPGLDYQEYIKSPEWKAKAEMAKEKAGRRCQVCNESMNRVTLDAHHRTYERLGDELPGDLIVLCRECHTLFHENGKLAR